jgi:hypothetical protein
VSTYSHFTIKRRESVTKTIYRGRLTDVTRVTWELWQGETYLSTFNLRRHAIRNLQRRAIPGTVAVWQEHRA